jgi:hypothetical protein
VGGEIPYFLPKKKRPARKSRIKFSLLANMAFPGQYLSLLLVFPAVQG